MPGKLWALILTSAAMRVGLSVDCLHSGPVTVTPCGWHVMNRLQSFHAEDVLWVLPLAAVIVVCNYHCFPHRWSLPATTCKQSSAMLTSLNTVIITTELPPTLSVSLRKKMLHDCKCQMCISWSCYHTIHEMEALVIT